LIVVLSRNNVVDLVGVDVMSPVTEPALVFLERSGNPKLSGILGHSSPVTSSHQPNSGPSCAVKAYLYSCGGDLADN